MREKISMDAGWKFHLGDIVSIRNRWAWGKSGSWNQGPESRSFDDAAWREVDLPHDFLIETIPVPYHEKEFDGDNVIPAMEDVNNIHTTAGSFQKEVGWYRKHFFVPASDKGRKIYFVFDGIYRDSAAYLNEFFIGSERSGYKKIVYDITDFINYGGDNLISVKADARQAEGWFYEGGGIYRHAYLLKVAPAHIADTFVWCEVDLAKKSAVVNVRPELENCDAATLVTTVFSPDGAVVGEAEQRSVDGTALFRFAMDNVKLWDTAHPHLYRAATTLYVGGEAVDELSTRFGIRDIRFDADRGFLLNGIQTKLKGVCCHQNHGGLGTALPDEVYRFRIKRLQDMGCNAYRTSHYPPTPELLDACDEMGMLVMDETRLLSSAREDLEQLECLVKRDRNHPCVILYSIGNEEAQSQTTPQGTLIAGTMIRHIKRLDPHTPVTMALLMWDLKNRLPIRDVHAVSGISTQLDVAGFNYQHVMWGPHHEEFPHQPMVCTEQGTFKSTRGCYRTDAANCHLSILDKTVDSYMKGAEQWQVCRPDWMSGLFLWTGFDYYGEPTPYAWPAISSQFGTMDLCGYPKDFYYYYKAWWSDEDVLHIFPHWNWNAGDVKDIYVFSNCDEVELYVGGRSLGKKAMERDSYLIWEQVAYEPGILSGVGYKNGVQVAEECIRTTGAPAAVRLSVDYREHDIAMLRAEIVDENGLVVPDGGQPLTFETDSGKILGTANGDPSDHMPPNGPVRRAFHGLAQAVVKAGNGARVTVAAEGLAGSSVLL